MLSVVVLISGSGSNLRALLEACDNPLFPARIIAVGSDNPARGLEHAELFGVPTFVVNPAAFSSRLAWAETLLENVNFFRPDLVVLAGFMKWLPANFVDALGPKIINIHPSLLPLFPGAHAVHDTLLAGAKITGATIHLVDRGIDTGPILAQRQLEIFPEDDEASLHERIKLLEREMLITTVREIAEGRLDLAKQAN